MYVGMIQVSKIVLGRRLGLDATDDAAFAATAVRLLTEQTA